MRDEYDFSNAVKNPYVKPQKTTITIRLETKIIDYFKSLASEVNIPYQTLINTYLADCVANNRKPSITW